MRLRSTIVRNADPVWRQPLFRLLGLNALAGATAAVVVVAGLVLLDVGGFGRLMAADEHPLVPFALVLFGFVVTLSSAAMGVAIMRIGADGDGDGDGRR